MGRGAGMWHEGEPSGVGVDPPLGGVPGYSAPQRLGMAKAMSPPLRLRTATSTVGHGCRAGGPAASGDLGLLQE
jgi:hypothetical protein